MNSFKTSQERKEKLLSDAGALSIRELVHIGQHDSDEEVRSLAISELGSRAEAKQEPISEPLYKMIIEGDEHWMTLRQAGVAYDSGLVRVSFGDLVLEKPGKPRTLTDGEKAHISDIADEWSASK